MNKKSDALVQPTSGGKPAGILNPWHMHFGQTLRSLRETRGITQEELAIAASLSVGTVVRNERSERCQLTRSNARRVMEALDSARKLTETETKAFIDAAGLTVVFQSAKELVNSPHMREAIALGAFLESLADPVDRAVFRAIDELIYEFGSQTILAAINGMHSGLNARLTARPADKAPLVLHETPVVEEGWEVQKLTPIKPPKQTPENKSGHA